LTNVRSEIKLSSPSSPFPPSSFIDGPFPVRISAGRIWCNYYCKAEKLKVKVFEMSLWSRWADVAFSPRSRWVVTRKSSPSHSNSDNVLDEKKPSEAWGTFSKRQKGISTRLPLLLEATGLCLSPLAPVDMTRIFLGIVFNRHSFPCTFSFFFPRRIQPGLFLSLFSSPVFSSPLICLLLIE